MSATSIIQSQWQNPSDIFSLLLLVGGDIIQKAIARLTGVRFRPLGNKGPNLYLTPIAFSFGWVAYGFMTLAAALGDQHLMPGPEISVKIVNLDNGYQRDNGSWLLGRLIRDRSEKRVKEMQRLESPPKGSTGKVSLLIDCFTAERASSTGPQPTKFWWMCWLFILAQHALAVVAWVVYSNWSTFMVTLCGTVLAVTTASLPQWAAEKWPSDRLMLSKGKPKALIKGNGHQYVMVILSHVGAWDLEAMGSSRAHNITGTRHVLSVFVILWVLLLITVTGLRNNTWFLLGVGGIGMLQNMVAAAWPCAAREFDIELREFKQRPAITGYQRDHAEKDKLRRGFWKRYNELDAESEFNRSIGEGDVRDVMGALMELEKNYPKAGAALLPVFFPGGIDYEPDLSISRGREFWKHASSRER